MKKSVSNEKFFPQERNKEIKIPANKAYFTFRFSTKKAKTAKKNTIIPM